MPNVFNKKRLNSRFKKELRDLLMRVESKIPTREENILIS